MQMRRARSVSAAAVAAAVLSLPAFAQTTAPAVGVPFPSMLQNAPAQPSGDPKGPRIPLSSQSMSMQQTRVDATLDRMSKQVDGRLDGLKVGGSALSDPDTAPYSGELSEMAEDQRQIRLLQIKQQRADLAVKLWQTTYDTRREDEAARAALAPPPVAHPVEDSAAKAPPAVSLPLPKLVSIAGGRDSLKATILVPYVGEMPAVVGTPLPGGRKVTKISADGVLVSDPRLGILPLGSGDSVPLLPPADPSLSPTLAPTSIATRPFSLGR